MQNFSHIFEGGGYGKQKCIGHTQGGKWQHQKRRRRRRRRLFTEVNILVLWEPQSMIESIKKVMKTKEYPQMTLGIWRNWRKAFASLEWFKERLPTDKYRNLLEWVMSLMYLWIS